jgi:lysylphosphatidylglycerol synthetase-like protein (DUF2156 family)
MTDLPSTVRLTRLLIVLDAVLWLAFGLTTAIGAHPSYKEPGVLRWAMATIALFAAGVLAGLAIFLMKRSRLAYWLAVASLAAMALAGLLDELGLADLVFLVATILPLALLLKDRVWYLEEAPDRERHDRMV